MLPVGSPIARASGSAFSATTIDVALAPKRKTPSAETQIVEPASHGGDAKGPDGAADGPYLPALAYALPHPWPHDGQPISRPAEPDRASHRASPFRARAPPAA